MLLMIDNYDSFVYNLVRYFEELGEEIVIYRNDKITLKEIENMRFPPNVQGKSQGQHGKLVLMIP